MIFAGKAFLVFLPVVLIVYHLLRGRAAKFRFLAVASWAFYAACGPKFLWVLLTLTAVDYVAALRIEGAWNDRLRRRWLVASVVANLSLLFAFKYAPFAYDNGVTLARLLGIDVPDRVWRIALPLGISFHTFQGISYTVDVYRRQIRAVRSFVDYALFVGFFPQLAAGPIVRAVDFLPQMATPPKASPAQIADGLHLFLVGLFKKLVVADHLDALFVGPVFADPTAYGPAAHRWAAVAWAAQIYADFSGYSDMAVGIAKWFGFELPRNFDAPYRATSMTDFWRRWHLSLSTWLRDYLYFPLGGNRKGPVRTYANLMLLFVLCGLWHGATWAWLVYGVLNGLLICLHRAWDRTLTGVPLADAVRRTAAWSVVAWAATMLQVVAFLVLVRMETWAGGWTILRSVFALDVVGGWSLTGVPVWVPLLVAVVAAGHALGGRRAVPAGVRAAVYVGLVAALMVFAPGVGKTFIYVNF